MIVQIDSTLLDALNGKIAELEAANAELWTQLFGRDATIAELQARVVKLQAENAELREEVAEYIRFGPRD